MSEESTQAQALEDGAAEPDASGQATGRGRRALRQARKAERRAERQRRREERRLSRGQANPVIRGINIGLACAIAGASVLYAAAAWYEDRLTYDVSFAGGYSHAEASGEPSSPVKLASAERTASASLVATSPMDIIVAEDPGPDLFDVDIAMDVVQELSALGPRVAGSSAEATAFALLETRLQDMGYAVSYQTVTIPGGTSKNLIVERTGRTNEVLVLGAHVDSKHPSPGANDNATGCGVLVALAQAFKGTETDATLRFCFFGAEEIVGSDPSDHHFGSRHYVESLSPAEKERIAGMVSVDMVGVGPDFVVRTMQKGPMSLSEALLHHADLFEYPLSYLKDSESGQSDHEPFENAGIPAAWLEWRDDPYYHTSKDTASHVDEKKVRMTGELVAGFISMLDEEELADLRK